MKFVQIFAAAFVGLTTAFPPNLGNVEDPADDGFPKPNAAQQAAINAIAGGQLPNARPPPKLAKSSLTAFQLIAFNENFEVAFFSSLISNLTEQIQGFKTDAKSQKELLAVLKTVKAQEELHAMSALEVLNHYGAFAPPPCTYKFPTTDLRAAITLANAFTGVVLGTLQDASQLLAANGDADPVRALASVIGQEGEQNGYYRSLLAYKPSSKPFLTTSVAPFAFSALQDFVVDCPFKHTNRSVIDIPIFPTLTVLTGGGGTNVSSKDQMIDFRADLSTAPKGSWDKHKHGKGEGLFVTYFTGQNLPISEPVRNASFNGNVIAFKANFPYTKNVMEGLTISALTNKGDFSSPGDVASATLAAPGLISVNHPLD
ncbi:unnamed protein product [Discula destructiva]